jgi:hypothetical protein
MNRDASITSVARALLLTGVIMLGCNAKSYAQTDIAAVKAAISSFHVALGALDIAKNGAPLGAQRHRHVDQSTR